MCQPSNRRLAASNFSPGMVIDWGPVAHKYGILGASSGTVQQGLAAAARALAEQESVRSWLRFPGAERDWIDRRHLEVCRVAAATFQEQARAEHLVKIFRGLGHAATLDDAGNVIVPIIFESDLPFVAVTAHLDTVLAPRQSSDIAVREDGTFEGPGVTDNGAGLAALLSLGRVFRDPAKINGIEPKKNILLVANVAEEGEGNLHGMNYLCRFSPFASEIASFMVLDGASTGHITAEALGSRRFEIVIEGSGGHSWNDFGTANPVHALARTVAVLADTDLPSSPRTTLSVGVIDGGLGVNSIAPAARAKVDIRSQSRQAMEDLVHALEDAVKLGVEIENRRSTQRLSSYKIREIGHRPAAPQADGNYVVDVIRAADALLGIRARLDCASTDANVPLAMGLPVAAIGAGGRGGNAHTPAEWFHPEGREIGLKRIVLALCLLLTEQFDATSEPTSQDSGAATV